MQFFVYPLSFYFTWLVIYFGINFVFAAKRIKARNYDNLFLLYSRQKGASSMLNLLGEKFAPVMFIVVHFSFFFITFVFSFIAYFSETANTFLILLWLTWSVWNGSCFYMDYFSKKYELSLERLEEVEKEINEADK